MQFDKLMALQCFGVFFISTPLEHRIPEAFICFPCGNTEKNDRLEQEWEHYTRESRSQKDEENLHRQPSSSLVQENILYSCGKK